jgi:hypothetical protein
MPGVGKLTVANILAKNINARLVDNHLLIDTVVSVCDRGSADYQKLLKEMMNVVLHHISNSPNQVFIFTNALSAEYEEDRQRFDQIRLFAENKNIPFVQILLSCDLETNKQRVISEDRNLKGKLTNPDELEKLKEYTIYHPTTRHALSIDTTSLTASETSAKIQEYFIGLDYSIRSQGDFV